MRIECFFAEMSTHFQCQYVRHIVNECLKNGAWLIEGYRISWRERYLTWAPAQQTCLNFATSCSSRGRIRHKRYCECAHSTWMPARADCQIAGWLVDVYAIFLILTVYIKNRNIVNCSSLFWQNTVCRTSAKSTPFKRLPLWTIQKDDKLSLFIEQSSQRLRYYSFTLFSCNDVVAIATHYAQQQSTWIIKSARA